MLPGVCVPRLLRIFILSGIKENILKTCVIQEYIKSTNCCQMTGISRITNTIRVCITWHIHSLSYQVSNLFFFNPLPPSLSPTHSLLSFHYMFTLLINYILLLNVFIFSVDYVEHLLHKSLCFIINSSFTYSCYSWNSRLMSFISYKTLNWS